MKALKPIGGHAVDSQFLLSFEPVCRLIDVEVPVLTLHGTQDEFWLQLWCDRDARHHRWLLASVSAKPLLEYLTKCATLLEVLQAAEQLILSDVTGIGFVEPPLKSQEYSQWLRTVTLEQLADYLPTADSYFDDSLTNDTAAISSLITRLQRGNVRGLTATPA